jgi:2-(1,2-epoxy-1,2-dihydrophenyl)acetyl-CoA isomerase
VNRVADASEALDAARKIAHGPLTSFRYMKANVNLAMSSDFRSLMDREAETHLRCGMTEDHREGVRAFMEKRAPNFTGR